MRIDITPRVFLEFWILEIFWDKKGKSIGLLSIPTNYIIMISNWKTLQAKAFDIIREKFDVVVASQEDDFSGVDCVVFNKGKAIKVDVKAQTKDSMKCKDTIILSKRHSNGVPKYIEKNDISVWIVYVETKEIYALPPELLHDLDKYPEKYKPAQHDYFGRAHWLAVVPLTDCIKVM